MGNYFTPFSLRTSENTLSKIKQIAVANHRSANKEIEVALEHYISTYEREHGKIVLPEE